MHKKEFTWNTLEKYIKKWQWYYGTFVSTVIIPDLKEDKPPNT
ncbi:MAG: hypothetical protein WCV68_00085 [Candidatus Paceibacterota bacterium]